MTELSQRFKASKTVANGWNIQDTVSNCTAATGYLTKEGAEAFATALNIGHTFNGLGNGVKSLPQTIAELESRKKELEAAIQTLEKKEAELQKEEFGPGVYDVDHYMNHKWHKDRLVMVYETRSAGNNIVPTQVVTGDIWVGSSSVAKISTDNDYFGPDRMARRLTFKLRTLKKAHLSEALPALPVAIWTQHDRLYIRWNHMPPEDHSISLQYCTNGGRQVSETLMHSVPNMYFTEHNYHAGSTTSLLAAVPPHMERAVSKHVNTLGVFRNAHRWIALVAGSTRDNLIVTDAFKQDHDDGPGRPRRVYNYWKFHTYHDRHLCESRSSSWSKFDGYSIMEFRPCDMLNGKWNFI